EGRQRLPVVLPGHGALEARREGQGPRVVRPSRQVDGQESPEQWRVAPLPGRGRGAAGAEREEVGRIASPSVKDQQAAGGSSPPCKPPPARHRPGARSARLGDVRPFYRRPTSNGRTNHVTPQLAAEPASPPGSGVPPSTRSTSRRQASPQP